MTVRRACVAAAVLLVTACQAPETQRVADTRYLRLADQDDIPTLDPARGYDTASWQFEDMLFNTLLDYDRQGQLVVELATAWEMAPDGRAYTFHVRDDARFSTGRPVIAEDIRFAIRRVLQPATRSPGAEFFRGLVGAASCDAGGCPVEGMEVLDRTTIRFRLAAVDPLFPHKLAMPFAAAVPAEEVERAGDDFGRRPVGSGPFVLEEWRAGQRLVFARNPGYFAPGVPRVAGVVRFVGVNDDLAWLRYEGGRLDVANIPPAEFPRVRRDPRYVPLLRHIATMRTNYLGLNCRQAPFSDRRVREALNLAVNKEKLLQLINGRAVAARGVLPPNMPGYDPDLPGYAYAPAQARLRLAEAGYPDGFASTLWVRADETTLRLAQALQQDLAAIGVRVRIKALAWGPFLEAVKASADVPMYLLGWEADFPDPSNFLEVLFHSKHIGTNNNTNYHNPTVDELLDRAARMTDAGERMRLLREVERVVVADAPWVPLFHPESYEIVSDRVRDYELHPLRPARFTEVWLSEP